MLGKNFLAFKSAGTDLCALFAKFIRVFATEEVNSVHITEFLYFCVVALDRKPVEED